MITNGKDSQSAVGLRREHHCTNCPLPKILIICLLLFGSFVRPIHTFNPIQFVRCKIYECCQEPYVRANFTKLESSLEKYLYGQPLVKNTLISALKSHIVLNNHRKALVLSFHGTTGVGKNFVTQLVAEALYEKGTRSRFFKQFIATKDFPHNERIAEYKDKIRKTIEEGVKECPFSLFVFDETDKIPAGLLDTIKAYIDFNEELEGTDFRRSVFIFMSNNAGKLIQYKRVSI
jgi:hypothetical protein